MGPFRGVGVLWLGVLLPVGLGRGRGGGRRLGVHLGAGLVVAGLGRGGGDDLLDGFSVGAGHLDHLVLLVLAVGLMGRGFGTFGLV